MACVPIGHLLICVSNRENLRLSERAADDLEADRQSCLRKAARNRDGGSAEAVEGRGIAGRPFVGFVYGGLNGGSGVALGRKDQNIDLFKDAADLRAAFAEPLEGFDIVNDSHFFKLS